MFFFTNFEKQPDFLFLDFIFGISKTLKFLYSFIEFYLIYTIFLKICIVQIKESQVPFAQIPHMFFFHPLIMFLLAVIVSLNSSTHFSFKRHFAHSFSTISHSTLISTPSPSSQIISDLNSSTKVQDFFYLYWTFNSNSTVTMALRWNTGGYFGLGFGTSMSGMDIIAAEMVNNSIVVSDRYSTGHLTPETDEELGGTNDITLLAYIMQDEEGFAIAKFNRKLNTGDQYDYVISQKEVSFCYAYSTSPTIQYHGLNKETFTFDFVEGQNNTSFIEEEEWDVVTQGHGYGNLMAWGFLAEIGVIVARYFKNMRYGIEIHAVVFGVLNLWTFIMAFWMIGKSKMYFFFFFNNFFVKILIFSNMNSVLIRP